jgi:arsenate reductase (glutaredoxin)
MLTIKLYGIPNCDTVKRARSTLAAQGYAVDFHDFKKQGVPLPELDMWLQQLGWQKLLNRQGSTWRKLPESQQQAVVDAASARAVMLATPSVIKRPVIRWGEGGPLTVGFAADFKAPTTAAPPA